MNQFDLAVLELILASDGKLTWYQLDRWLTGRANPGIVSASLMPTLHQLEEAGLITAKGDKGQPLYFITSAGRQLLEVRNAAAAKIA